MRSLTKASSGGKRCAQAGTKNQSGARDGGIHDRNTKRLAATSLLLAAPAIAAQPEGGHYVYVPAGATVVMLPAAAARRTVDFPVARMIAQQQAMMQHMMADMDSLMATPMPDPQQMIRSVMDGMPQTVPGPASC